MSESIAAALSGAKNTLAACTTAYLDAELLLAKALNKPRSFVLAYPDLLLTDEQALCYQSLIEQRAQKTPLAYLTGKKEFWSLSFIVTPDVLIPRPETELLLELLLKDYAQCQSLTVFDLGTGCGALAIALAKEKPHWQIVASDFSLPALDIAKQNATRLLKKNAAISFVHSDWLKAFPKTLQADVIISNPPYLAENDAHLNDSEISHEPRSALVSAENGLLDIQKIATQASLHLQPKGRLYIEHGFEQADAVGAILKKAKFLKIHHYFDLCGMPRVTRGTK